MSARGTVLTALAVGFCMLSAAAAADFRAENGSMECQPSKPPNDPRWWSFRLDVGGERRLRCWYPGKPGKSKTELHWGRRPGVERPGTAVLSTPSEDPRFASGGTTC